MTTDLITVKQVTKTYGSKNKEIAALKDISLAIPKGTTLGIIGESGSGKTTLGKLIAGSRAQRLVKLIITVKSFTS